MSTLQKAEALCKPPPGWDAYQAYCKRAQRGFTLEKGKREEPPLSRDVVAKHTAAIEEARKIYSQLCLLPTLTPNDRLKALTSYLKHIPEEGADMLARFRDMVGFLRGAECDNMVRILVQVTRSQAIGSHERMITAVSLYNHSQFDVCYDCFSDLACDTSVMVKYRVEATRYLFASENDDHLQTAQEALLEIIDSASYPSEFRYSVIAGFISTTGIGTMLNVQKLKVPYDEEFVYSLQTAFFYNKSNGVRERILSGQHMLAMRCVDDVEKKSVGDTLLAVATDDDVKDQNIRGDAADVVLRLGTPDQRRIARQVIADLGFATVEGNKGNLLERTRTIYSNAQNVHDDKTHECVERFIERIVNETNVALRQYNEVHQEVTEMIRRKGGDQATKFKAYKALNRVSVDTATFTKLKVTIAEVFIHVWIRIQQKEDGKRENLEDRMFEELVDMSDTCSSGHAARFVNVLSLDDATLVISWESQIKANIVGRMNARIQAIEDEDQRGSASMGCLDDAEPEDVKAYKDFIMKNVVTLRAELRKEFVGEGYIREAEFNEYFERGVKDTFPGIA